MGCCGSSEDVMNPAEVDLSHFEVGACIGKGGFGKVHAVIHKGSSIQMAMKLLTKAKIVTKQWHIDTVWVERNLLELMKSPYINSLYFSFQTDRLLYVVMPYMRGGDLGWYLHKKGKMRPDAVKYYGAELALGLSELRRINVVYRDFKPENCLFTDDGHICITDFGICARLNKENNFKVKDRIGTVPYMSPEQYQGQEYDYSADYFAFGLTLFEMATNQKILQSPRDIEKEDAKFYESHFHHIPNAALADLVKQLLNLDQNQRIGVKDINEIFEHKFFTGINWDEFRVCKQTQKPPYIPDVTQLNCHMSNFAADAFGHDSVSEMENMAPPSEDKQVIFKDFEYNTAIESGAIEHWEKIKQENGYGSKNWDNYLTEMWDKPIDVHAFKPPESIIDYSKYKNCELDIRKSLPPQIEQYDKNGNANGIASADQVDVSTEQ